MEMEGFLLPSATDGRLTEKGESEKRRLFQIEYKYRDIVNPGHPSGEIPTPVPEHWEAGYDFEDGEVKIEHIEEEVVQSPVSSKGSSKETEVSYKGILEPPLTEIALAYINAHQKRRGEPKFTVTPQVARADAPFDDPSPFSVPKVFGSRFIDDLELPEGWPPDYEDGLWKLLKDHVLSPVAAEIDKASRVSTTYVPSYRASGQAYYGPADSLTGLLKSFEGVEGSIRQKVNTWIEKLDLGRDLQVERKGPSLYEATIERNGERRSLADCGSGVSQLLPLILQFTVGSAEEVLLVEEPEANLHPDLQARLADLFGDLAKGRTAIVETHSEYFVRRIQYLIARGSIEPGLVQLLYIEPPDDQSPSRVRPISIDEQGQLSESFGPGFFDEATDLMVDLFKYGSEN